MFRSSMTRVTHDTAEATASGIYGLISACAVLVGLHGDRAAREVLAVVITLTAYWAAERFARIVAGRIHEGHLPAWHIVRRELTSGWEMVSASALPLLVLVLFWLAGARLATAELAALICATVLLGAAGWRMGASGRLTRAGRLGVSLIAASFGVVLTLLKIVLH